MRFSWLVMLLSIIQFYCKKPEIVDANKSSIFNLLGTKEIIDLELSTYFDSLRVYKEEEQYQSATLTRLDRGGHKVEEQIMISARGKTRKNYCEMLPLRLKFQRNVLEAAGLASYKTLKLVVPCKNEPIYQDYVIREYLCYQLCQLITGNSFRVQMAKVQFNDAMQNSEPMVKHAFLIEHEEELARRLDGKLLDDMQMQIKTIDNKSYNLLVLFQYMIGNTDWNLSERHNIKLIEKGEGTAPFPVPYDFDYSGLVNTEYAVPYPNLPIKNVRDRFFQWRGKEKEGLAEIIQIYLDKKESVFELINGFDLLSGESRNDITDYINSFYKIIEVEDAVSTLVKPEK